jgi:lipopolysaccharide export system protein LptA
MKSHDVPMRLALDPIALALAQSACAGFAVLLMLAAGAWWSPARAERADRDQPTNVESDRLYYDEAKQTTEFTGRVVLTKGTLLIRSDHMVLRQLAENQQVATARGKPATFRQKRDGPGDQYVNGSAQTLDYDSRNEKLTLTGSAMLIRSECGRNMDQITGALIVYDGRNETFSVDGGIAGGSGAAAAGGQSKAGASSGSTGSARGGAAAAGGSGQASGGRVRVTIQPRADSKGAAPGSAAANPCPPAEPARLKPESRIGSPRPDAPSFED